MKFESIIQLNRYLDVKAEMRDVELQTTLEVVEYQIRKALQDENILEELLTANVYDEKY